MKKSIILIILILCLTGCKRATCLKEAPLKEMKKIYSKDNLNFEFMNSLEEFSLTKQEIKSSKKLIEKAFDKFNSNLKRSENFSFKKLPNHREYNFLYTPFYNKKNEKVLFIKGYRSGGKCEDLWTLEEWYGVRDGGNSFIQFTINLSKETVSYIMPNGEA